MGPDCGARKVNPEAPVPGHTFGQCVTAAMTTGQSATVVTKYAKSTATGSMQFASPEGADVAIAPGGQQLLLIGTAGYLRFNGRWYAAKADGNQGEVLADAIAKAWRTVCSPAVFRDVLSSSDAWTPAGKAEVINGVEATPYSGRPALPGTTVERYVVWVDSADKPVRVEADVTLGSTQSKMQQDFSQWGKEIRLEPPI